MTAERGPSGEGRLSDGALARVLAEVVFDSGVVAAPNGEDAKSAFAAGVLYMLQYPDGAHAGEVGALAFRDFAGRFGANYDLAASDQAALPPGGQE